MYNDFSVLHVLVLLITLAVIVAVIWAIVVTWRVPGVETSERIVWSVILFFFSWIALIVWFVMFFPKHRGRASRR